MSDDAEQSVKSNTMSDLAKVTQENPGLSLPMIKDILTAVQKTRATCTNSTRIALLTPFAFQRLNLHASMKDADNF
jgi:hypothetical protein